MPPLNAFVTPAYPVLFTPIPGTNPGVGPGETGLALALLVRGIPSFLATPVLPDSELAATRASLEAGEVRVAVVGLQVEDEGGRGRYPVAFVSLLCADGRRLNLARIPARDPAAAPEALARFVTRQIVRGVQIPDLVPTL
jgi:hypothetical protein